jgi:hypothetical protein
MSSFRSSHPLRAILVTIVGLAVLAGGLVGVDSASAAGTWSDAVRIVLDSPRTAPASFNAQSDTANHLSCTSDGACILGGSYYWQNYGSHAMLATSTGGVWSDGTPPPGFDFDANIETQYWLWAGGSVIEALSCSSPVECAMVGFAATNPDRPDVLKPFVSNWTGGVWGDPQFLLGLGDGIFANDTDMRFTALSCSATGECVAVGRSGFHCDEWYCWANQAFLMVQTGGVWQPAIRVPGLAGLNLGSDSQATSVSCSSPGNCMVGGFYSVMNGTAVEVRPFVTTSTNHVWSEAVSIPGVTPNNIDNLGPEYPRMKVSVSCPTDGTCVVGGYYSGYNSMFAPFRDRWGFVATGSGNTWTPVFTGDLLAPGTTPRIDSSVTSVSCATATSCTAIGAYTTEGGRQGFIATLSGSTWTADPLPGLAALNTADDATITSVSCVTNGTCALGGSYLAGSQRHAFVASKVNGAWSDAVAVPQLNSMNLGGMSEVTAVSCSSTGDCSAIGIYRFDPQNPGKQRVFATRLSAGGDPSTSITSTTSPSATSTTIDGSESSDADDGANGGQGDGAGTGATDQIAPTFTG